MNTGMYDFGAANDGLAPSTAYPALMVDSGVASDGLFDVLWKGRWLIMLATLTGLAAAYLYVQMVTPLYESRARILIDRPASRRDSDAPQPVGSTSINYLQTQASMITSRAIIAAALREPNVLTLPTLRNVDYPAEEVIRTLSASIGKNTDIVSVVAQSAYPDDAAQIVNAVVQAYVRWHEANRQLSTADLLKDLNSQLDKRYQELQAKRKERMLFEQRHPEVVESFRGGITSKTLELLKQDLATARLNTIEQDSYYEGLKRFVTDPESLRQYVCARRASTAVPVDVRQAERVRLQDALFGIQSQLEQFSAGGSLQQLTLLQNREKQLKDGIAELDNKFVQEQVALGKVLSEDAHSREEQLSELYEKEFAKVQSLSGQDSEYAFLLSECEMMQSLCDSLLKQINALDLNARFEGLSIHVLERALPARQPVSPQLGRIMGMGLVLGLMVGAGLALLRSWRDQRVRSADEITALLGVPVLGALPSMPRRRGGADERRLHLPSDSCEAEAYRAIRTALFFGVPYGRGKTILVTSPGPLEGKTTIVSNLGMAMATAGQRTLIVDADLRRPMQWQVFGLNRYDHGLIDVLSGTTALEEAIRPTEIQGLDVLASAESAANPSELLHSQAFADTLEQLKGKYDRILIDSPPIGVVTDSQILAAQCDLTLLVLRARRSVRQNTRRTRDALLTVGARVVGVVVNDVSRRDSAYSYSHYYVHYGSYGHERAPKELPVNVGLRPGNGDSAPRRPLEEAIDMILRD